MKKMLVPFDEKNPGKRVGDFIYPVIFESGPGFVSIKKAKKWSKGMVVYTGVDISANDVFAKIVDAGNKIDDVDGLIRNLESYVTQLSEFTIGNVLEVEKDDQGGFRLKMFAERVQLTGTSKIP